MSLEVIMLSSKDVADRIFSKVLMCAQGYVNYEELRRDLEHAIVRARNEGISIAIDYVKEEGLEKLSAELNTLKGSYDRG